MEISGKAGKTLVLGCDAGCSISLISRPVTWCMKGIWADCLAFGGATCLPCLRSRVLCDLFVSALRTNDPSFFVDLSSPVRLIVIEPFCFLFQASGF